MMAITFSLSPDEMDTGYSLDQLQFMLRNDIPFYFMYVMEIAYIDIEDI